MAAGVPYFWKQWGEFEPWMDDAKILYGETETNWNAHTWVSLDGRSGSCWVRNDDGDFQNWTGDPPEGEVVAIVNRVGKKSAGRLLDGRTWDEFPNMEAPAHA